MKLLIPIAMAVLVFAPRPIPAQEPPEAGKSLAATLDVYVFSNSGQDASQQAKDEGECYNWAVQSSGVDPFMLQKQARQQQQETAQSREQVAQSGRGAGLRGAARGAAGGAIIGELADDEAGKGAAIGGAAGAIASRRRAKAAQEQAGREIEAQTQQSRQAASQQMENFRKAFSVCLEAKKYMVKY